jgi:hypothetical protein
MMGVGPDAAGRDQLLPARVVVVHRVAVRRTRLEHRDFANQTARRDPDNEHRSTLAAREEGVILVELPWRDIHLFGGQRPRRARRAAAQRVHGGECGDDGRRDEQQRMAFHISSTVRTRPDTLVRS